MNSRSQLPSGRLPNKAGQAPRPRGTRPLTTDKGRQTSQRVLQIPVTVQIVADPARLHQPPQGSVRVATILTETNEVPAASTVALLATSSAVGNSSSNGPRRPNEGNRTANGTATGNRTANGTAAGRGPQGDTRRSGGPQRPSNGNSHQNQNRRTQHSPRTRQSGAQSGQPAREAVQGAGNPAARAETVPAITEIMIPMQLTVRELAEKMGRSPIEVIKTLMNYGIMVPITQSIDFDTAVVVGEELGVTVKAEEQPEPAVEEQPADEPRTLRQRIIASEDPDQLVLRPPVVTVLGHVDHGKTTLLDAIRETRVVEGEAGGITQHVGAYQVERNGRRITFLDTPGHEAFTAMRARGASVTDIAVLVVAADDGVMPQTKEAIAHARAAQVPIIVALNKIDKPNANPERVKQELADNGLLIEEYGGDVMCVPVSAKFRRGIDDILESIILVADIDPLKANPNGKCVGSVIESRLDKSRGATATLLIQNGTLHVGDSIILGDTYGKVRAMFDDKAQTISEAPPSTPAQVLGLDEVPVAGDTFEVVADERTARAIAAERQAKKRADNATPASKPAALEDIFAQIQAGQAKDLNLILKADVQGSIEPIINSLEKLSNDKVRVKLLHAATGHVTESDVMLAVASNAIILGFSVNVDTTAQRMADAEGVDIRLYNIIYKLVEDVEKALAGMLEPVFREVITGHAEVRAVFYISKVGKVAGCYVTDGDLTRGMQVRVRRAGEVIREDRLVTLKRYQEDAAEVKTGYECGINLGNYNDFEVGDIVEGFKKERVS